MALCSGASLISSSQELLYSDVPSGHDAWTLGTLLPLGQLNLSTVEDREMIQWVVDDLLPYTLL